MEGKQRTLSVVRMNRSVRSNDLGGDVADVSGGDVRNEYSVVLLNNARIIQTRVISSAERTKSRGDSL